MCNFWNFCQWQSFMPKYHEYGSFKNGPASRKKLSVERKKITTRLAWGHMCSFVNIVYASFSLLYQNWHADLDFDCKFCFLVINVRRVDLCRHSYWRGACVHIRKSRLTQVDTNLCWKVAIYRSCRRFVFIFLSITISFVTIFEFKVSSHGNM